MKKIRVFAPATVALSGTLLDSFGFPLEGIGDVIEASFSNAFEGVRLVKIKNNPGLSLGSENVSQAVGQKVFDMIPQKLKKGKGVQLILEKNMKIGTGMGSSAASGVAAAVAVNALFGNPLSTSDPEFLQACVHGEFVACGSAHSGNVMPCLFGGLVFIFNSKTLEHTIVSPPSLFVVLVSPDLVVTTREARRVLWESPYDIALLIRRTQELLKDSFTREPPFIVTDADCKEIVKKSGELSVVRNYLTAGLHVAYGFKTGDLEMIGSSLERDSIVTACRGQLIKGFSDVKEAARKAGASAFCISGSGPAVFCLAKTKQDAEKYGDAMITAFKQNNVHAKMYVSKINQHGATLLS